MKKWKCKLCGEVIESTEKPVKCTKEGCESTEFEEIKEQTVENLEEQANTKINDKKIDNLEKKLNMLMEQLELEKQEKENLAKEKDAEILKLKKLKATEEELKALEAEEEKQKAIEEQSKILKVAKDKEEENKKIREKLEQMEFDNFKLKTSIEKPYLESVLKKCDTKDKYDIMMELIDENELKAKYEAENNSSGSIINIKGAKSIEDSKPKTVSQILAENIKRKEQELRDKRKR